MTDENTRLVRVKKSISLGNLFMQQENADPELMQIAEEVVSEGNATDTEEKPVEEPSNNVVEDPQRGETYDADTGEVLEQNRLVGEGISEGEGVNLEPGGGISRRARAVQHLRENYNRSPKSDYISAPKNDYSPEYNAMNITEGRRYPPERTARQTMNGETRPATARNTLGVPQFVLDDAAGTSVSGLDAEDLLDYATDHWEDKDGKPRELSDNWKRSIGFILQALASYDKPSSVESDRWYSKYKQDHEGITLPGGGIRVNDWADNIAQSLGYPSRDEYLQRYAAPIFVSAAAKHIEELAKEDPRVLQYMQLLNIGKDLSKDKFWGRYYDAPPLLRQKMRAKAADTISRKLAYALYYLDRDWLGDLIRSSEYDNKSLSEIADEIEEGSLTDKDLEKAFKGGLSFDLGAIASALGGSQDLVSYLDRAFKGKMGLYGNDGEGNPVLTTRTVPFDIYTLFKEEDMAPNYGGYDEAQGDIDALNRYRSIAETLGVDPMDFNAMERAISERLGTSGFAAGKKSVGLAEMLKNMVLEIMKDNRRVDAPLARALKAKYPGLSGADVMKILYQLRSPSYPGRYYDFNANGAIREQDIRAAIKGASELDDEYTGPTNSQEKAYGRNAINALYYDLQDEPLWKDKPASLRDQLRYQFFRHPDDKYGVKYKDAQRGEVSDPDFGTIDEVTEKGPNGTEITREVRRIYDENGMIDPRYTDKLKKWADYANAYMGTDTESNEIRRKVAMLVGGMTPEVKLEDGTVKYPPSLGLREILDIVSELKRRHPDKVFPDRELRRIPLHQLINFIQDGGLDSITSKPADASKDVVKDYIKYGWDEILPIMGKERFETEDLAKLADAGLIKLSPAKLSSLLGRDVSADALAKRGVNLDALQRAIRAKNNRGKESIRDEEDEEDEEIEVSEEDKKKQEEEKKKKEDEENWYLSLLDPAMEALSQYVNWDTGADLPITDEEARKKKDMAIKLLTSYADLHPDQYDEDYEATSFADDSPGDIYRYINGQKVLPSQTLYRAYNIMNARQRAKSMLRDAESKKNRADYVRDPETASILREEAANLTKEANDILSDDAYSPDDLDFANMLIAYPAEQRAEASLPKEMSREEEYVDKEENDLQTVQDTVNAWIDYNFDEDDPDYEEAKDLAQKAIWVYGENTKAAIQYLEESFPEKFLKSMPRKPMLREIKGKKRESISFAKSKPKGAIRKKKA